MFIFAEVDGEATPDFSCYQDAVRNKDWDRECQLAETTRVYLNRDTFSTELVGLDEINTQIKHVVIDNTHFPSSSGTYGMFKYMQQRVELNLIVFIFLIAGAAITTMVQTKTQFNMTYNIKSMTIYCKFLAQKSNIMTRTN